VPSSYRSISLLDAIGKLFEKILLVKILNVVNERGLLRDEQFQFRPKHSTSLQLARLVKRFFFYCKYCKFKIYSQGSNK